MISPVGRVSLRTTTSKPSVWLSVADLPTERPNTLPVPLVVAAAPEPKTPLVALVVAAAFAELIETPEEVPADTTFVSCPRGSAIPLSVASAVLRSWTTWNLPEFKMRAISCSRARFPLVP
jgi:hypothetical protein